MTENREHEMIEKWFRLQKLMQRLVSARREENPHRGQGRVLTMLNMQPEITQKQLAYLLDMRQQSVSELLIKLEKRGLVRRGQSEEDGRITVLSLTEAGRAAVPDPDTMGRGDGIGQIFSCLSGEELAQLEGFLDRLNAEAEKAVSELPEPPHGHMPPPPGHMPPPHGRGRHGHHHGHDDHWGRGHYGHRNHPGPVDGEGCPLGGPDKTLCKPCDLREEDRCPEGRRPDSACPYGENKRCGDCPLRRSGECPIGKPPMGPVEPGPGRPFHPRGGEGM